MLQNYQTTPCKTFSIVKPPDLIIKKQNKKKQIDFCRFQHL